MKRTLLCILLLCLAACQQPVETNPTPAQDTNNTQGFTPLAQRSVQQLDDGTNYIVHPSKIEDGGPPQDGIPSIDNPQFISVNQADQWIEDNELILALEHNNVTRAYPLQILVFHEIVNDNLNGDPIAVTYCPLCGSGIAYERKLDGEPVEFGTSGKLYNSNLVMYDRKTETYWSQIDGVGILGERAGNTLTPVPIDTVSWGRWKQHHPDAAVLSKDTGYMRPYGDDPYGSYYNDTFVFFDVENRDDRIHPKTVVYGININGSFKAYRDNDITDTITDTVAGETITATRNDDGTVTFTHDSTPIAKERDFWFAWYAFHPTTELYQP